MKLLQGAIIQQVITYRQLATKKCCVNDGFNLSTPSDVAKQIAARVKARRLELNLTQGGIAIRAGLKFAT